MKNRGAVPFYADPLFAAANSGKGFISFYDDVFNRREIERRYIIKGGPGTGKSSFMRRMAETARARGMTVETYRCSSDPDSLDGLIIDGRIAFWDGTSPHSADAELPGARDEIINLGEFWDAEALGEHRGEIERLNAQKSACYRKAYRYLEACDGLYTVNREMILPAVRQEKLQRAVSRLLREIPDGAGFRLLPGLASSVGMKGYTRFDSYERSAKTLYVVEDHYETGALFLRLVITEAMKKNCPVRVSYHPIHLGEPDAVFFEETGDCFTRGEAEREDVQTHTVIHMKRFTDAETIHGVRGKWRMNRRLYDAMLSSACDALKEAGAYHFALEQIYVSCMDFQAQSRFTRGFAERLK